MIVHATSEQAGSSPHTAQRRGQERDGRFRPARLGWPGSAAPRSRGHLRTAMEFLGSSARAGGHIAPALRDPASRSRRRRHPGPPGALTRGMRRHGDVRCQHHDADISTHFQRSAHRFRPFRGPRSDCPSATTFHCFSSGSHAMAPHVQAILALRSHFLDPVQDALNSPRRIARHDLPPHEPHEDGSSERLHAH